MNILFLTLGKVEQRGIYSCLIDKLNKMGNKVFVVSPIEKKYNEDTSIYEKEGVFFLKVRSGNLQKVNKIEKGISTIKLESQLIKAIKTYLKYVKFDLVIYSTPPITFSKVISYIKKRDNAKSYLMLKDIFPQNAVDIEMMKRDGLLYKFFRKKEIELYNISDYIGCMSQGNVDFLIKHNDFISKDKVEILPNTITPLKLDKLDKEEINKIRDKYNVPKDKTVLVYGGNLGKPQGIDFIIDCVKENEKRHNTFFLIIGSGTDYDKLNSYIKENNIKNTSIYSYMPKEDYDNIVKACDIGLVFLDNRFTIPNIPSRILTYMEFGMPIIAATDKNTDLDEILEDSKSGLWSESGNLEKFYKNVDILCKNKELIQSMGMSSRNYLDKYYTSENSYEIIMKHFEKVAEEIK